MLVWKYFILGVIFTGAVVIYIFLKNEEKKDARIKRLTSKRLENLLEQTTIKIGEKQNELKRTLTEEEKNIILDKCYSHLKVNNF